MSWLRRTLQYGMALTLALVLTETLCAQQTTVWRGRWTSNATARRAEHGGPLRVRLKPTGPGKYQGTFSGRFALVIPYFYRADVHQYGNTLHSTKKLGPLGEYQMTLHQGGPALSGTWQAGEHRGRIQLSRRR